MDIKKMIDTIETKEIDAESFVSELHDKLVKLYNEKDIEWYTEIFKDMLSLAVHLKFDLVLKYFEYALLLLQMNENNFRKYLSDWLRGIIIKIGF